MNSKKTNEKSAIAGPIITLVSASFFALNTPIAPFVYASGSNSITLAFMRLGATILIAGLISILLRQWPKVTKSEIPRLIAFSICMFAQGFCYLSSVAYIPVSLAALLLYTWPIMAAFASPLIGEKRPNIFQLSCFAAAFIGLAFAFAPSVETLDLRGVILAILGAVFTVGLVLISRVSLRKTTPLAMNFYSGIGGIALAGLFLPFMGGFIVPADNNGLIAMGLICLIYPCAVMAQFFALRITTASLAAILYNMEPVISIVAAFILLGEILSLQQYLGGAIVIGSLILYALQQRKLSTNNQLS